MQTSDTRRRTLDMAKEDVVYIPSKYTHSKWKSYWKRRIRRRERRAGKAEANDQ
jgi:hypothetical protein